MRSVKGILYAVVAMALFSFGCTKSIKSVENPIVEIGKTTIANLANPGEMTYYIDESNSIIYVSGNRRERLKEELGATGNETYWIMVREGRERRFEVRDIDSLDYGQIAEVGDTGEKHKYICLEYTGCVNVKPWPGSLPQPTKSIKYNGKLCKKTDDEDDVCDFEIKRIKVECFRQEDCPGIGQMLEKNLATCE